MKTGFYGRLKTDCSDSNQKGDIVSQYMSCAKNDGISSLEIPFSLIFGRNYPIHRTNLSALRQLNNDVELMIRVEALDHIDLSCKIEACLEYEPDMINIFIKNKRHCEKLFNDSIVFKQTLGLIVNINDSQTLEHVIKICMKHQNFRLIPQISLTRSIISKKAMEAKILRAVKSAKIISNNSIIYIQFAERISDSSHLVQIIDLLRNQKHEFTSDIVPILSSKDDLKFFTKTS